MSGSEGKTTNQEQKQEEKQVELCAFFIERGYCTLGTQCKLLHDRSKYNDHREGNENDDDDAEDPANKLTEICFSFDTTGSMFSWLQAVRTSLREIIQELFGKIENLRIALIAHGDYCDTEDWPNSYTLKSQDFTRKIDCLLDFTKVKSTYGGGDGGECYEYVMWYAINKLSWTRDEPTNRVLVIIGDEPPHTPDFYQNRQNLDWRQQLAELKQNRVVCYGINCGGGHSVEFFYKGIATETNGAYLQLSSNKGNLSKLIMGLCLKTSNNAELLQEYRQRLMRSNQCDKELANALNALGAMVDEQWNEDYDHVDARPSSSSADHANAVAPRKVISSAIKRLLADLNEVRREKLDNVSVVPESGNVFSWHCNVQLKEGLLKDEYVHFVLTFDKRYPSVPPKIYLRGCTLPRTAHENITNGEICLPLFGSSYYKHSARGASSCYFNHGSGWSAAYSITSLLLNICSILSEVQHVDKGSLRGTRCQCGHDRTSPFPPLECNKLPIELVEYDYNDAERLKKDDADADAQLQQTKAGAETEKKDGGKTATAKTKKKTKKTENEKENTKKNHRGISIVGNTVQTQNRDQYWILKSAQDIRRRLNKCVAFEFELNWFDPKTAKPNQKPTHNVNAFAPKPKFSDVVFGFVNASDAFFGVDLAGNLVFDNKVAKTGVFDQLAKTKVKKQDVLTFILKFRAGDAQKDELVVLCNYDKIAHISVPSHLFEDRFYPQLFLKNTRIYLHLRREKCAQLLSSMKVKSIKKCNLYFMDGLPQHVVVPVDRFFATNEHYKDQVAWNWLFERAFSADVVLEIASYLDYIDLVRCKYVCVFWRNLFTNFNLVDRNEMYCFFTRESVTTNPRCVLGVGLNVEYSDNRWIRNITTDLDLLSLTAYIDYDVRKSVWGRPITHFLPLVINEQHGELAEQCMIKRLAMICQAKQKFDPTTTLSALTAVMNEFVVQLMHAGMEHLEEEDEKENHMHHNRRRDRNMEAKHASEKALIGYCSMHHLLIHLALKFPKLVATAQTQLQRFIGDETYRHKALHTHNLGKLLLNLTICLSVSWDDVKFAYIEESSVRNVKFAIEKYANLAYLDAYKCTDAYRLESMLKSTTVSRRLIKFQLWFLRNIARPPHVTSLKQLWSDYNRRWGRPTPLQKQQLLAYTKKLLQPETCFNHNAWLKHYADIGVSSRFHSRHDVVRFLRENVVKSRQKSYHYSDLSVVAANRAFELRMKFNLKKDAFHRRCVSRQRAIAMHVLCNPSKYEGLRLEYEPDGNDDDDDGKEADGAEVVCNKWVNIYDAKTHRWYIGYILDVQRETQTCSVMFVGWNKHFVEKNVPLQSTMMAKFGTVPLALSDANLKAGYIGKPDDDSRADGFMEEYDEKVAQETQVQKERYEKIHFYHREFFKAVTENDLEKVKKFLMPRDERVKMMSVDDKNEDEDDDKDSSSSKSNEGEGTAIGNNDINAAVGDGRGTIEYSDYDGWCRTTAWSTYQEEGAAAAPAPKKVTKNPKSIKLKKKNPKDNSQELDKIFDAKSKQAKTKKKNRKKPRTSESSVVASFYFDDRKPKKITPKKVEPRIIIEEFVDRQDETERLYWHNFDIEINREMTDAFNRTPLFLSCYMGLKEMTKLLLSHSFDVNVGDINGENALNQILYSQKHKLVKDADSMELADLISTAMQEQKTLRKQKNPIRDGDTKYYVRIGGLSEVRSETEVIDLCEMYDIYPSELIFNRDSAIAAVYDRDIMSKIHNMDESFFRCSLLSVSLLKGNAYDPTANKSLPTNTLYVTAFDSIADVENKLLAIFSKYGKLRKKSLVVKINKSAQNFTFVEYVYIKDAVHAYNDIHANKYQQRLKLNTNAKSNRKIFVRFAKTFSFGGQLGGAGFRPPMFRGTHGNGAAAKQDNHAVRNGTTNGASAKQNKNEEKEQQQPQESLYFHQAAQVPREMVTYENCSYKSALCFIPPMELWPSIQALRSKYDPEYMKCMPQISIFYPFVDEQYFAEIASFIKHEVIEKNKLKPFEITLQSFDMFERTKNYVHRNRNCSDTMAESIFLQPDIKSCGQMKNLYTQLAKIWYEYSDHDYKPHLMVGKFQARDLLYYKMQFNANYKPISWTCDALYLISRAEQGSFCIKSRIPLYSGANAANGQPK